MKTIRYTNNLGCPKKMDILSSNKKGLYCIAIWDLESGTYCGVSKDISKQEIINFFEQYGIAVDL